MQTIWYVTPVKGWLDPKGVVGGTQVENHCTRGRQRTSAQFSEHSMRLCLLPASAPSISVVVPPVLCLLWSGSSPKLEEKAEDGHTWALGSLACIQWALG